MQYILSTWVDIMDTYTPDDKGVIQFNDYLAENYIDRDSSLFSVDFWNINKLVEEKDPQQIIT
jgi:hypothetical protein